MYTIYLDLTGNPLQENPVNIIPRLRFLRYVSILRPTAQNKRSLSSVSSITEFESMRGVRFLLEVNDNDYELCGDCSPVVQYSGDCFFKPCANATNLDNLKDLVNKRILRLKNTHIFLLFFKQTSMST